MRSFGAKSMTDSVKLAISICSNRPMEPRCAIALSMLVHHLTAFQIPFGLLCRMQASLLPQAREECLSEALQDNCTHQLWIDDDIEAPGDAVLRMLHAMRENPDIDVLAVNYCRKQDELRYTAEGLNGEMVHSHGRIGVEEVDKVGMGLMLVKLDKVRPLSSPFFEVCWSERGHYRGEDRYFTRKLREAGLRIFVDHGISNFTQHWGSLGYNFGLWHSQNKAPYATLNVGAKSQEQIHREQDGVGE